MRWVTSPLATCVCGFVCSLLPRCPSSGGAAVLGFQGAPKERVTNRRAEHREEFRRYQRLSAPSPVPCAPTQGQLMG